MKRPLVITVISAIILTAPACKNSTAPPTPINCSGKCATQTVNQLFALDRELANRLDDHMLIRNILDEQKGVGAKPSRFYADYILKIAGSDWNAVSILVEMLKLDSKECAQFRSVIRHYVSQYKKIKTTQPTETELNELAVRFLTDRREQQEKCLK
jgi:hypothetical protein